MLYYQNQGDSASFKHVFPSQEGCPMAARYRQIISMFIDPDQARHLRKSCRVSKIAHDILVGGLDYFPRLIGNHNPNRLIFFRGVETTKPV